MKNLKTLAAIGCLSFAALAPTHAQIIITEVDPNGSGDNGSDWFELTNFGSTAVTVSGWKMDDNSYSTGSAVALNGISSIAAGESVIYIETTGTVPNFDSTWFGSSTTPANLQIGTYGGSGVGLSNNGDAVNVWNSSNSLIAAVQFGTQTGAGTFDNSVLKLTNTGTASAANDPILKTFSVAGVNGAFDSKTGGEVGSPGTIGAVPEPSSWALAFLAACGFGFLVGRNKRA